MARGHVLTALDDLDPQVHGPGLQEPLLIAGHVSSGAVRFLRGDVTDRGALASALEGQEAVVHLAAAVGVGQSMYEPHYYVDTNATGTGLLLDLIAHARGQVGKLVVASSRSLYGEGAYGCSGCGGRDPAERTPARLAQGQWEVPCPTCGAATEPRPNGETKPADIASVYAATKKHQEDLFVCFGRAYRIPTFALRFFNVFGPRQNLDNPYTGVVAIFLSWLLNGRPPLLFEDGQQSRDLIDVRDIAEAIRLAVESDRGGQHVLNVGTGRRTTVAEVAAALTESIGADIPTEHLGKYRAGDIRHCFADPTRAEEILGFRARFTLKDALPPLIEWCRTHKPLDRVEDSLRELTERRLVR